MGTQFTLAGFGGAALLLLSVGLLGLVGIAALVGLVRRSRRAAGIALSLVIPLLFVNFVAFALTSIEIGDGMYDPPDGGSPGKVIWSPEGQVFCAASGLVIVLALVSGYAAFSTQETRPIDPHAARTKLVPLLLVMFAPFLASECRADDAKDAAAREFFEKKIRPVLVRECYECHSGASKEPKGGLRVDARDLLRKGGDSGPALVPGKPVESLLIQALKHDGLEMPPKKRLPDAVVADFTKWIEAGAADPRDAPPPSRDVPALVWDAQFAERRNWWSLQPVTDPQVPEVKNVAWPAIEVDRFILAALERKGLSPARPADRVALARRLHFVLLGLPPSPDEVDRFVNDASPEAWRMLVDRTLASPRFGERFARHWMDAVRYSDTYGYEWDMPAKGAWRYRDYLIKAFNEDVPFDQLVREQIAGDLLEHSRIDPVEKINLSLIGPMFFQMGEKRHGDSSEFNGIHQEMLDNKVDAFSQAFQGTTVACARCHDHKLDAVAQKEYYALAGSLMSSRWVTNTLDLPERDAGKREELKRIKHELRAVLATRWLNEAQALTPDHLTAAWKALAPKPTANAAKDKPGEKPASEKPAVPPLAIDHPLGVWSKIALAVESGGAVADAWKQSVEAFHAEREARVKKNAGHFEVVADFRKIVPEGWSVDGVGLREPTPCGDIVVALTGEAVVDRISLGGLVTNSLSPRMNGALRTPYATSLPAGHLSFEIAGGDFSARRSVIDNAFLTEKQTYLANATPAWQLVDTLASMSDRKVYTEFATKTSNPNFPPRVGLGGACSEEQAAEPRSWFAISRVVRHTAPFTPVDELARIAPLFEGEPPASLDEAAARYRTLFAASVERWSRNEPTDDDVLLLNWLLDSKLLTNRRDGTSDAKPAADIAALVDRYRTVEATLTEPQTVNGMADVDPGYDYRLNVRGDYDQLGDAPPRGYLAALGAPSVGFGVKGSGRRELAEIVASPRNPLTARVYVNRVWQWLFGQGLVRTPDDFGHLGDAPSHPELLDHLARRFMDEGWSTKRLVRAIVLSETWRQSGETTDAARAADPDNRLLHHFKLQRLDAESLRDTLLAVSGRLEQRLYGPTVNPNRPKEDPQKRLFSGPVDGDGRRSLYTKMTIMEVPKFLAAFNQPDPKIPTGRRDVTNTAAQSLALLNDPLVSGQAEYWATRLVKTNSTQREPNTPAAAPAAPPTDSTPAGRIDTMFRTAFSRRPTPEELARWSTALHAFAEQRAVPQNETMTSVSLWKDIAHAMLNMKELIHVR